MRLSSISLPRRMMMSGRNGGVMNKSCPDNQGKRQLQIRPWPKWVGNMHRVRAKSSVPSWSRSDTQRARNERWVCKTPLGAPVEPEVNRISASSSSRLKPAKACTAPVSPVCSTGTLAPASACTTAGSVTSSTTARRGAAAATRVVISNAVSRASIGTAQAPRHQSASNSAKNSSRLPNGRKTRSPRARPWLWKRATRWATSRATVARSQARPLMGSARLPTCKSRNMFYRHP